MPYTVDDVGAVFTCCLYPEFTKRAIGSVLSFYPGLEFVVIDDACRGHEDELADIERTFKTTVIRHDRRRGCGRALDTGLLALTRPLLLTVDHGVEIKKAGLLERMVIWASIPGTVGVGLQQRGKKCTRAFGEYVNPYFALWDRQFIVDNDLSFKLTAIKIKGEDWKVGGCSTAEFLCYRAVRLGGQLCYVGRGLMDRYLRHHRTPRTRGTNQSTHELVEVDEDFLIPRRRRPDGTLAFKGDKK